MVKILYFIVASFRLCMQTANVAFDPLWIINSMYSQDAIRSGLNATLDVCIYRRMPQRYNIVQWFPKCAPRIPKGPRPVPRGSLDTFL